LSFEKSFVVRVHRAGTIDNEKCAMGSAGGGGGGGPTR